MRFSLVWLRLYFPYIPKISVLLKEAITPTWEVLAPALSMKALVLILMLIAVDVKSDEPPPKELDRQSIVAALARCGLELLFTPPHHRHTLFALELIMEYCPTALVTGQTAAAPSLKGEVYVMLMKRIADKIGLQASSKTLRAKLADSTATPDEISQLVKDTLLWTRICHLETNIGALITKLPPELVECQTLIQDALVPVGMALNHYVHLSSAIKFLYIRMVVRASELQAYIDIKLHANDLHFLSAIMASHKRASAEQKRSCATMLERNKNATENDIVRDLVDYDVDYIHANVAQHVISFGVLSGCLGDDLDPSIDDVIRISELMIENIKLVAWDSPSSIQSDETTNLSIPVFLARFAPTRPADLCHQLKNYLKATTLTLNGFSWQGPSRETACCVLYLCKLLTEENAARMKGWQWLCEDVDTQLLLYEDAARMLTKMDIEVQEGEPTSLEQGSIYAASAKLIRSLATIVGKWKNKLLEQQSKQIAGGQLPAPLQALLNGNTPSTNIVTPPEVVNAGVWKAAERAAMLDHPLHSNDTAGLYAAIDDAWQTTNLPAWTEVNFDDWNAWPQANTVDFWDPYAQGDVNQYGFG